MAVEEYDREYLLKWETDNVEETTYLNLLEDILSYGETRKDRTGTGSKSIFGRMLKFDVSENFPLITTKKMAFKTMVKELLWFLKGDTNIQWLVQNNCHIWNGDAYKHYKQNCRKPASKDYKNLSYEKYVQKIKVDDTFAAQWGELGPIYGASWRNRDGIDQLNNVIEEIKVNPTSRRLLVDSWDVSKLKQMCLVPCHYAYQFYVSHLDDDKPKLSLMWNQRSVDTCLGLPMNIASYALLLKLVAKQVDMEPCKITAALGDCHIYLDHIEGAKEQISRKSYPFPKLEISDRKVNDISEYEVSDFNLIDYKHHPKIYFPLSN